MTGSAEPLIVVDTSVALKWFLRHEALVHEALALRQSYLEGEVQLAAPDLLIYELANVLRYKTELTTAQVREATNSIFDMGFDLVPVVAPLIERAINIARHHEVTVYDASFTALAELLNAQFVTADERLAQRLAALPYVRPLSAESGQREYE